MIFLILVLTNYVPEVSVIHKELTLFRNIRCKLRTGGFFNIKINQMTNLLKFWLDYLARVFFKKVE